MLDISQAARLERVLDEMTAHIKQGEKLPGLAECMHDGGFYLHVRDERMI